MGAPVPSRVTAATVRSTSTTAGEGLKGDSIPQVSVQRLNWEIPTLLHLHNQKPEFHLHVTQKGELQHLNEQSLYFCGELRFLRRIERPTRFFPAAMNNPQ